MAGKNVAGPFTIQLHVKDPDAFGEICEALGDGYRKWFEFAEYATVTLVCEVKNGKPVIVSGEFEKVR
jgi:hypothetical protein